MTSVRYQDLPLADRDRKWDKDAADRRVRRWAGAEDAPNERYRSAFLWYDGDKADEFTAYKLPIGDIIDGELKAVPRAVFSVAQVLDGARGGVDLPKDDEGRVRKDVERYYHKMGEKPPFEKAA